MNRIIIPRRLIKDDDLVVIPRGDYETLLGFSKIREFTPTAMDKKNLKRGRKNFHSGNYVTLKKLRHELERSSR
ncbi:MAG TPA: hypothetical protein VJJ73_02120 [Candidatus Paceibacterota bacterium]